MQALDMIERGMPCLNYDQGEHVPPSFHRLNSLSEQRYPPALFVFLQDKNIISLDLHSVSIESKSK